MNYEDFADEIINTTLNKFRGIALKVTKASKSISGDKERIYIRMSFLFMKGFPLNLEYIAGDGYRADLEAVNIGCDRVYIKEEVENFNTEMARYIADAHFFEPIMDKLNQVNNNKGEEDE